MAADAGKVLRVYADTSVFGGCFDDEFSNESTRFFEEVREGRFVLVVSDVTLDELELAPDRVRAVLAGLPPGVVELVGSGAESDLLQKAYLESGVVGPASTRDGPYRCGDGLESRSRCELELQTHCAF